MAMVKRVGVLTVVHEHEIEIEIDEEATEKEVDDAMMEAWWSGCVDTHEFNSYTNDLKIRPLRT